MLSLNSLRQKRAHQQSDVSHSRKLAFVTQYASWFGLLRFRSKFEALVQKLVSARVACDQSELAEPIVAFRIALNFSRFLWAEFSCPG